MNPGLRKDALGLLHVVAIGIAGTAPSYTIAVSTAALVAATGVMAPAVLLYCGLVMAGITCAFVNLNRVHPNAGASYAWVGLVLHRDFGFLCGWVVLVTSVLFTVSATIPAATATLLLLAPELAGDQLIVTGVAACWIVAITLVEVRGMRLTGALQSWITGIEIAVLAGLALIALVKFGPQVAAFLGSTSFAPSAFSAEQFAASAVIAVFFFWGWDVTLNASEETSESRRTPGVAAVVAMLVVALAFVAFAIVTLSVLGTAGIEASGANVLFALAEKIIPRPWSYLAVLAVMLSSLGSLQVSLLQFARTLFAAARAGDLPARWSAVHPRWQTPHAATWLNTWLGLALLTASLALPGIDALLKASVNAIGLEIAFYYGLAALACAWHFHREARGSMRLMAFAVVWPLASAIALWWAAALALRGMDAPTVAIGVGGIAIGVVPLILSKLRRSRDAGY